MFGDRPAVLHHIGAVMNHRHGLRLREGDLVLFGEARELVAPGEALVLHRQLGAPAIRAGAAILAEEQVIERDHLPSNILMIPEKSLAALPLFTNRLKSCAASAPSGVAAPAPAEACWASSKSFSIIAAE